MSKFKPLLLSIGCNIKLAKDIAVWNLPPLDTCPGATDLCRRICYACKAQRCYKSAREKRKKNYDASQLPDFESRIIAEIKALGITKVRIHESGDFYNQEYVDKWARITAACPDVTFLAFTKSFMLDFTKMPPNVVLGWSIDKTTTLSVPSGRFQAYLVDKGEVVPAGYFQCTKVDSKRGHKNYCGASPVNVPVVNNTCSFCWAGGGNVAWPKH